jgi:hypothetical protein
MGAALPWQAPPDASAGRGSSHRHGSDVRKHTEGESVAMHSLVRIEGVRGSNPLSSTQFYQVSGLARLAHGRCRLGHFLVSLFMGCHE